MHRYKVTLKGDPAHEVRVPASVLHETLGALLEGARCATRFMVEGESTRKGQRPAWLDAACAIDITGLNAGSLEILAEAPTLRDADGSRFGVPQFSPFDPHHDLGQRTALDLFGEILASMVEHDDDVVADKALLSACARFARAAGGHFRSIRFEGLHGRTRPLELTPGDAARIERLSEETPLPQTVRVCGILDTISASQPGVVILMGTGERIRGKIELPDQKILQDFFGREVAVTGTAHFSPSGRLLLVVARDIALATEADQLFAEVPNGKVAGPLITLTEPVDGLGVSSFFGAWSDDDDERIVGLEDDR